MRLFISASHFTRKPGQRRVRARLAPVGAASSIAGCVALGLALGWTASPATAAQVVSCGGAAMAGGAELMCSHVVSTAPPQFCTYSWSLMTTAGAASVVQGSFLLPPGAANQPVYQGYGFNYALSNPIVMCQGRRS